ncbi:hypothetical protein [Kitasatospora sp. NPDC059827]|uniref:hypothetical protein n=1 Tax=Kitasatospora sp. NPDC059827 TaxID=3346964 RepID=UPI003669CA12
MLGVALSGGEWVVVPFTSGFEGGPVGCWAGGALGLDTSFVVVVVVVVAVRACLLTGSGGVEGWGWVSVGCVYLTVGFSCAWHPDVASLRFAAATSGMSGLFEGSVSVRKVFTGLCVASGGCVVCSARSVASSGCAGSTAGRLRARAFRVSASRVSTVSSPSGEVLVRFAVSGSWVEVGPGGFYGGLGGLGRRPDGERWGCLLGVAVLAVDARALGGLLVGEVSGPNASRIRRWWPGGLVAWWCGVAFVVEGAGEVFGLFVAVSCGVGSGACRARSGGGAARARGAAPGGPVGRCPQGGTPAGFGPWPAGPLPGSVGRAWVHLPGVGIGRVRSTCTRR